MKERFRRVGWVRIAGVAALAVLAFALLVGAAGLKGAKAPGQLGGPGVVSTGDKSTGSGRMTALTPGAVTATTAAASATTAAEPSNADSPAPGGVAAPEQVANLDAARAGIDQKVVSTANLQLEVAKGKFQSAFDQATLLAQRYDGYIVSSQSSATGDSSQLRSGTIALRVPAASFPQALRDAGQLGTVKSRQVDSQDVTGEYVDLQARLVNAQTQEKALQDLLVRAKTVNEVLQVRQVLSANEQEIEQLKGQLQYLKEHTSYATLTLGMVEVGAVVASTTPGWGFVAALEEALRGFVATANGMIVGLGSVLPVVILLVLGVWIVYRLLRSRKGRPLGNDETGA
jgi:Domain of unknown function (DUF4349)